MGKKRMAVLGSEEETQIKAKSNVKREQKKLRTGKTAKAPAAEPLAEVVPAKKTKKVRVRSKNYQAAKAKVNPETKYSLSEAIKLLRDISYSKTNDTVELHVTLNEKGISRQVDLPHSTGKARKVAIADEATLAQIEAGKVDFDILLASSDQMPKLVKYAKVLGPKGLMPNPKNGTLVENPEAAAKKLAGSNLVSIKTEKDAPLIHTMVGKLSMTDAQLIDNISIILNSLSHISKVVLKSTMSPAIKLAL